MSPDTPGPSRRLDDFLVGVWLAQPALCRLSRDGATIRLRPQLMDLLGCLARRAGRVVSKDEILAEVWPGQFIAESGLSRCVAELRQALGDDPHAPAFIETIAKRGYRLIATVSFLPPADAPLRAAPVPATTLPPATARARGARGWPRRHWLTLAAVAAGVAAVLAGLALRAPALSEADSVVLCFENRTGEPTFDRTLQLALAVQLEQSPFLRVISEEQVREALRLMGRDPDAPLARAVAVEICRRQGARAMIAGSIGRVASRYVLGLEGIACESGDVLAREQAQAAGQEGVLDALGGMVRPLRRRLGESLASVARHDVPITRATTASLDALGAASLGDLERRRGRYEEASAHYRRAVALDPAFALAYSRLGSVAGWLGNAGEYEASVRKAFDLRGRTSLPERLEIEARYHQGVTGEFSAGISALEQLRQSYPRSGVAHFGLAHAYAQVGRFDESLAAALEAARLEPGGNRESVQLARAYLYLNRFDEARQVAAAAAARGIDGFDLHGILFDCAFAADDAEGVSAQLAWSRTAPAARHLFLLFEAEAAVYAGQLRLARSRLRDAQSLSAERGDAAGAAEAQLIEAGYEALYGRSDAARQVIDTLVAAGTVGSAEALYAAAAVALAGDPGTARRVMDVLDTQPNPPTGEAWRVLRTSVLAAIETGRGAHDRAIRLQAPLVPVELGVAYAFVPAIVRAQALLGAGRHAEAIDAYQGVVSHHGVDPSSEMLPLARLGIARAQARSGHATAARAAYDALLALWAAADPDLPIALAARQERARLE